MYTYTGSPAHHVERGRKILQMHGFPTKTYRKTLKGRNFKSKVWVKILSGQISSRADYNGRPLAVFQVKRSHVRSINLLIGHFVRSLYTVQYSTVCIVVHSLHYSQQWVAVLSQQVFPMNSI